MKSPSSRMFFARPLFWATMVVLAAIIITIRVQNRPTIAAPTASIPTEATKQVNRATQPLFDENYAYNAILQYEKFGPKVPGTEAHVKTGDWIVSELKSFGITTIHEQKGKAATWNKPEIPVRNIIAQINPEAKTRYLLSAHWDNRPVADEDENPKNRKKPVPGVNDGGSGVVVLLAIAKAAVNSNPTFGIDFAFWDAEDWGNPNYEDSYCLGSQMWAKNTVPANYQAKFGINFDMVGRKGSLFPIERYSQQKAPEVVKAIRDAATTLGYLDFFPDYEIGPIIDDHQYVTEGTGIKMVDLIFMDPAGRFPPEWHTVNDTSEAISRDVLKVVGQTAIQTLWSQ